MSLSRSRSRALVALSVIGVVVGCSDSSNSVTAANSDPTLSRYKTTATVTVSLPSSSVAVPNTLQATAVARDSHNNVLSGKTFTWSSTNTAVATVSSTGLVTAVGAGSVSIQAKADGVTGSSASLTVTAPVGVGMPPTNECAAPGSSWIFCDDFETDRTAKYSEYDNSGGKFVRTSSTGVNGSVGMRATYTTGAADAGHLLLAFGATPTSYFRAVDAGTANYREVYWRFYVRREPGWVGNGAGKLSRATIFAKSDWSQAMIAHGWTSDADSRYFLLDPASGTDASGNLTTIGYNDFTHLQWLGSAQSSTTLEDQAHVGMWSCYEFHARLNDAGQSNGLFELSVNGQLSARSSGLNWVGSFSAYGINAIFLEQYQNNGAPAANVRTLDNFVVSTHPIGCGSTTTTTTSTVASVAVSPATPTAPVGQSVQLNAATKDGSGNSLTGKTVTWTSGDQSVATVSSSGLVTMKSVGSTTISATSDGVTGSASATATPPPVATVTVSLASPTIGQGQTTQATATLTDAIGNVLTGRTITWSSSNSPVATVSSTGVVTAVAAGTANITATSEGKTGSAIATVSAPASTTLLAIATQPSSSAQSGTVFAQQPVVQLRDASGNHVSSPGVNVAVTIASGSGTLGGTVIVPTNSTGTANFTNLQISGSGTYTLLFSVAGLTSVTSSAISVSTTSTTSTATKLALTTQPSSTVTSGSVLGQQPSVQLQNSSSGPVSQSGVVVTASVASGTGTLGGTTTATTNASGVATFSNLSIIGSGAYTLRFSSTGLTSVTSNTTTVTSGTSSTSSGSSAEPTPSGTIVLDWRAGGAQDMQAVSTLAAFKSYYTSAPTPGEFDDVTNGNGNATLAFTTNYNGNGKHALRVDWPASTGTYDSGASTVWYFNTTINQLYCSFVIHLGMTATGGGVGTVGSFSPTTLAGGSKRWFALRNANDGTDRVYWVWGLADPSALSQDVQIDNRNWNSFFTADFGIGQDVRWTFRVIPASSSTASDGIVQAWRNGVMVMNDQAANIGNSGFQQFITMGTRRNVQAESEYWTDLVVWRP
jgi:uncharacterized protein YjdB